jgi:ATP-dependent helicase/nuclease subunit A
VADAVAVEQAARSREELNALYVALTRTQSTLVLSSLQPRSPNPSSWWSRLAPHAQAVESVPDLQVDVLGASADQALPTVSRDGVADDALTSASFDLLVLPELPAAARLGARTRANAGDGGLPAALELDSDDSRIGQAMHRLLEWLPVRSGAYGNGAAQPQAIWSVQQLDAAARQFSLDSAQMAQATQMARAIASGAGAWAWDADQLQWHHNEVPISRGGRLLRIDRLVQTRSDGHWWVLDYKSKAAPQLDADLCAQLLGYRAAIAHATAGQVIRAAFLTPQGALIEINTP